MQTEKPRHHVIFLGAGASLTSGFPIGEKLRLRLANENHFFSDLDKAFPKNQIGHKTSKGEETEAICLEYFRRFKPVVELFRHGGFGTVDEFSKLAADKYPEHTQDMKKLMRLAFALHNPEDSFHKSDYYPFIQRLFSDDLHSLKSNITIISYNYDCYLDYLLLKAYEYRKRLSASPEINPITKNTLTSGFFEPTDITWAEKIRGLSWLFHGKKDAVEVVVANLENRNFPNVDDRFHPASLTGRVVKLLRRVAPGLNTLRSSSEHDGNFDTDEIIHGPGIGITPRYSFKEFIEKEMN